MDLLHRVISASGTDEDTYCENLFCDEVHEDTKGEILGGWRQIPRVMLTAYGRCYLSRIMLQDSWYGDLWRIPNVLLSIFAVWEQV